MRVIDADRAIKHLRKLSDRYSELERNEPDFYDKSFYRGKALAYLSAANILEIAIAIGLDDITESCYECGTETWGNNNEKTDN